ncbi:MAG: hypothetical protein JXA61_05065 [Bacteroidales bacterium]|nr:hypothetical protein [Bacteroidales bacterium]
MIYRESIILLFFCFSLSVYPQQAEYSHQVKRVFPISNAAAIDITNKYGMVQVITWDKDSVSVIIDLYIKARDNKRLEKLKKDIEFDFRSGQYFLIIRTIIGDGSSDIIQDIVDIASTYFTTSTTVTIDYTVYIPDYSPLKIENKFGDVYIDDLKGNLNLDLSYGELKANLLNGKTEISLSSGDADVNEITDGQISVSYSDIRINSTERMIMDSRSSVVSIDRAVDLRLNSRRDKVFLGETGTLSGESYFTDFKISTLNSVLNYRAQYGNMLLENIRTSFTAVNLTSDYADLELVFEHPMDFSFELTHHQDVRFVHPKSSARLKSNVVNAEEKQIATTGSFGSGSTGSRVLIVAEGKCDLIISSR